MFKFTFLIHFMLGAVPQLDYSTCSVVTAGQTTAHYSQGKRRIGQIKNEDMVAHNRNTLHYVLMFCKA